MVMRMMRTGASGGLFKYLIFGLIGMSVGGLVVMDVRGVLSGTRGVGGNDVARIGEETLPARDFDRTLRRALMQYRIDPQQAYKIGLVDEVLSGQLRTYLLAQEAESKGIELSKERLAARVAEMVRPNMMPGQSMQETLESLLYRQGLSEMEFVNTLKREIKGELLMQDVRAGLTPDNARLTRELYRFSRQTRDIEVIFFPDSGVSGIDPATDEQLERLYESLKNARYKIPEYRSVKMAVFDPEKLDITVEVSPEEIRKAYEDNKDRFTSAEELIISQALVDTPEVAQKIYEQTQNGKSLKDAVVAVTGSEESYYERISFESAAMLPDLMAGLETIDVGGITAPVKTMLGNHVIRLDEVVEPALKPFEAVEEQIRTALLKEKEDEEIYAVSQDVDEALDRGTSFEEIAKELDITLETSVIGPFDENGLGQDGNNALGGTVVADEDLQSLRELAFELAEGETSLLQELPSGALVSFALSEVVPQTYKPFDMVKGELAEQYMKDQRHAQNYEIVGKYLAEIGTGGSDFNGIAKTHGKAVKSYKAIGLGGAMPVPLTPEMRPTIFQNAIGGYDMLELGDQFALMKVSGYSAPQDIPADEGAQKAFAELSKTVDTEMEDDGFLMYIRALADAKQPTINQRLLDQLYGAQEGVE